MATITLSPSIIDDYVLFLRAKSLPRARVVGRTVEFPDEYAATLGLPAVTPPESDWTAPAFMFDYQAAITRTAIAKKKYAGFIECGLGKTLILLAFADHAARVRPGRKVLIVSPLMVIRQTLAEARRFYGGDIAIEHVPSGRVAEWLSKSDEGIGITNYEGMKPGLCSDHLSGLILDESSLLKSHYGKWGSACIDLGKGVEYKLALTGTPAPNDRVEFANHAVFLDQFPTVNAFLARFFINRGQTDNRWELKPHALEPFYRALSDWSIFLTNPATYGWKDNATNIPPIEVQIHHVELTDDQIRQTQDATGMLFAVEAGGITQRSKLARIAKGHDAESLKPEFIRNLVESWPDEQTLIWCRYNDEQEVLASIFPGCADISGDTPIEERERLISEFQAGSRRVLISKPKILGFGLNLQCATRQVFSSLQDSYEEFHQAVKRSNRIGSTRPLSVHIPATELEYPMIQNVLRKADRIQADTVQQERMFRHASI